MTTEETTSDATGPAGTGIVRLVDPQTGKRYYAHHPAGGRLMVRRHGGHWKVAHPSAGSTVAEYIETVSRNFGWRVVS